ncbi:MAG TPA: DUF2971 domain-containing protein [Sedimentisphaerales bacterium]
MPLFKYVKPDLVKGIQNLTVRFSPPSEFNDPFELLPDTKVVETQEWIDSIKPEAVRDLKGELPNLSEREIEQMFLQRYTQRISTQKQIALDSMREMSISRILSLSKIPPDVPRALLLWGHYTENHTGMVFEFDDTHAWVQWHHFKHGESHDYQDVQYRVKRPGWNKLSPADEFLYTKSKHWIYEQEVRLIRFVGDKGFDTSTVDALVRFPADLLRSITLGVNNTSDKTVRDALNANSKLAHVVLYKAKLHPDEYKLTLAVLPR